jgi:hypothetical protein
MENLLHVRTDQVGAEGDSSLPNELPLTRLTNHASGTGHKRGLDHPRGATLDAAERKGDLRVTPKVLKRDDDGNPSIIFYPESPEESAERQAALVEQSDRGRALSEAATA